MSGTKAARRALFASGVVLLVAGASTWWLRPIELEALSPPPAQSPRNETSMEPRAPSTSNSTSSKASPVVTGRTTSFDPTMAKDRDPHASTSTSVIDQLIAMHAISSQAEVSRFLEQNAELAAQHVDRFCEESAKLGPAPFRTRGRFDDAAYYMLERSDWVDPPRIGTLHLPDELMERIAAAGEHWPEQLSAAEVAGLDFGWLDVVRNFDHWSLRTMDRARDLPVPDLVLAVPDYVTLMAWAKLRLVRAMVDGNMAPAAAEVRQLAELIRSQEILLAEMVAIQMLRIERQGRDAALRRGLEVGTWSVPSDEALEALRRMSRVEASFLWPGVDAQTMKKALACAPSRCVAVGEAAWVHVTIGSFSPEDTADAFWALAEGENCDPRLLGDIRAGRAMSAEKAKILFEDHHLLERIFAPPR